jgi:tetratricopeptide (TPR) repeat protein
LKKINKNKRLGEAVYKNLQNTFYLNNYAMRLVQENKINEALSYYKKSISIDTNQPPIYFYIGLIYKELKEYIKAIEFFNIAVDLKYNDPELYFNLANTQIKLNNLTESCLNYKKAILLNPQSDEYHNNLSLILKDLGRLDESLVAINQAILLNPQFDEYHNNLSLILKDLGRLDESLVAINQAILLNPQNDEFQWNKATFLLALKNFKEGWHLYEKRHSVKKISLYNLKSTKPKWNGETNIGRLFIWSEQGIGDQILFLSLLFEVLKSNNQIIVSTDKRLIKLLERSFKKIKFISSESHFSEINFDYQISLSSLGSIYRKSHESFKSQPYSFLKANKIKSLKKQLGDNKVFGISWLSLNKELGHFKSIKLEDLLPIFNINNVTFVSLQYTNEDLKIKNFNNFYGTNILNIKNIDKFNDIDSLISLISDCRLIITTSNVTAHLAGALGIKAYVLVPFGRGKIWYWSDQDQKSLWYPSIKIFNQSPNGSWKDAILNIEKEIKETII